jgi:hypothetical protein
MRGYVAFENHPAYMQDPQEIWEALERNARAGYPDCTILSCSTERRVDRQSKVFILTFESDPEITYETT